ncbi:MAG: hypothetical protein HGA67_02640 [Candidatus Yonathbacteria bacterium]|nr:hypothetical protein [Candidatus Yonathbacteria bacterium]
MSTTTPSLTCEALRKKAAEFPCFIEGMFADWEPFITRTFKGENTGVDEKTEKMLQDASLYVMLFRKYIDETLNVVGMFEDAGATRIRLEIETIFDGPICIPCPEIYGEFAQGTVCYDTGCYEKFFYKDGEVVDGVWTSDRKDMDDRGYSLQKFLHGDDWEPEEENA